MPLSDREHADIISHLREMLREFGFGALDERIVSELADADGHYEALCRYLRLLIGEWSIRSEERYEVTMERIRSNALASEASEIRGIRVWLSHADRGRNEQPFIELRGIAGTQEVISDLEVLLEEITEDGTPADRDQTEEGG